ncbi:MAG: GAP family protein [Microbacteriaceae bacterium]
MNAVIGDILAPALGIALSPIAVIAAILMLRAPSGKRTSLAFLLGWLVGILVAVVVFTLLASIIPASNPDVARLIFGVVAIVLGAALLLLAAGQLRTRPGEGEEAKMPAWMSAIDSLSMPRAGLLGLLLAVAKPKNLLLAIAAGLTIGDAGLRLGPCMITIAIFVVVAASTVLIPVVGHLIAGKRLAAPLETLHIWLVAHTSAVLAAVMFIVGVVLIGNGIAAF